MNCTRWYEYLLTDFGMAGYTTDFELHLSFNNYYEFVCAVNKIFPTLPWRIYP